MRRPQTDPVFRMAAAVLAAEQGLAKPVLKRKIRELKALGLTHSLPVGYAIAARGTAYLARATVAGSGG